MKNEVKKLFKTVDFISDHSGKLISLLFFPGWVLVLYSVIMRYFFNAPSYWAGDYAKFLFAVYFVMGGAYCLVNQAHIRVDVVYNLLSHKKKMLVELLAVFPLLFAFIFPFIWHGYIFAWDAFRFMETSPPPTHLVLFPVKFAIPIAGSLFLIQATVDLFRFCFTKEVKEEKGNEH